MRLLLDVTFGCHHVCLRICGKCQALFAPHGNGVRCFRVPPFRRHSFGAPVSIRSARDRLTAINGLTHRNAVPPSGRPAQHLTPSRSSAWLKTTPCAAYATLAFQSVIAHEKPCQPILNAQSKALKTFIAPFYRRKLQGLRRKQ